MNKEYVIRNLKSVHNNLPIGIIATSLGAMTLSNVYVLAGFPFLKDFVAVLSLIVLCIGITKVFLYPHTIKEEFNLPVIASLFPTVGMLLMAVGSHVASYYYSIGKGIWLAGIIFYFILMVLITYKHVVKKFNYELLTPAFFVPFVGVLVACVTSSGMNEPLLCKVIFIFGTVMYIILLPIILKRVFSKPIQDKFYPTIAILVAPPSLVVTSYITVFENPNVYIVAAIFIVVLFFLIYVYTQIPKIVNKPFHAGFASLTFPTAISCFASYKVSIFLEAHHIHISNIIRALVSIELVISTTIITFVIYSLFVLLFRRLSVRDAIE